MEAILWMQNFANPVLDVLAQAITILGEDLVAVSVCAVFLWCVDQRYGYRLGFVLVAGAALNGVLKNIFRIPRPWQRDFPGYEAPLRQSTATGYSFPSGHAQNAAMLGGMLCKKTRAAALRAVWILLVLLVGLSRIYCRVHTWQDVLGGFVAGGAAVFLLDAAAVYLMRKKPCTMLWMLVPALALLLVPDHDLYKTCGLLAAVSVGYTLEQRFLHYDVRAPLGVQVCKVALGLLLTALLRAGLKPLLGASLAADALRYFCVGLFVSFGAPYLFAKLWGKRA